jgi:hypothetical protein
LLLRRKSVYYQPPPPPGYYGPQYSGCLKGFLYLISFFIPLVGVIVGLVYMSRVDPESKRLGQACLIIGIVGFVVECCIGLAVGLGPVLLLPFLEGQI